MICKLGKKKTKLHEKKGVALLITGNGTDQIILMPSSAFWGWHSSM